MFYCLTSSSIICQTPPLQIPWHGFRIHIPHALQKHPIGERLQFPVHVLHEAAQWLRSSLRCCLAAPHLSAGRPRRDPEGRPAAQLRPVRQAGLQQATRRGGVSLGGDRRQDPGRVRAGQGAAHGGRDDHQAGNDDRCLKGGMLMLKLKAARRFVRAYSISPIELFR